MHTVLNSPMMVPSGPGHGRAARLCLKWWCGPSAAAHTVPAQISHEPVHGAELPATQRRVTRDSAAGYRRPLVLKAKLLLAWEANGGLSR
jgi:hypothetical protein